MHESSSDLLNALLQEERNALVRGDLEGLQTLADRKSEVFDDLDVSALPRQEFEQLQHMLDRNQALLSSALDGIRAVATRMAELRKTRSGLETYDQSGSRSRFETRQPQALEKRA